MKTAVPVAIEWIRIAIGDGEVEVAPSPGIEPRLLVEPVPYDDYLDPTRGSAPKMRFTVDLVLTETGPDAWWVAQRCEVEARRVAEALGVYLPATAALRNFSLEAALGGESLPYNRVSAPHLILNAGEPHEIEEHGERAIRVFTATARTDGDGATYTMRLTD